MREVEELYRRERARVLASLLALLRDFDLAEEALHDAFLAASQSWPRDGVPTNPRAWLVSAGRFKAIDRLRKRTRQGAAAAQLAHLQDDSTVTPERESIEDDTLRLVFVCCHPELTPDAQIALTLREVCGLTTEEIATAFLSTPATVAQRIVRAKAKLAQSALPFEAPPPADWPARLDIVLQVIYLIFNEGYAASRGDALIRQTLCDEAVRLARLLAELHRHPDIDGLLALLLLQQSRGSARVDAEGDLILLEDQDRALWDGAMIAEALARVARAAAAPPLCTYTIQAMIAAQHAGAPDFASTDWPQIVRLYDLLLIAEPSPVVALNRAAAIAMRDGPAAGLVLIDALLAEGKLAAYRFAHSARADLLRRLGRDAEAREAYTAALALTRQAAERAFLERRLRALAR